MYATVYYREYCQKLMKSQNLMTFLKGIHSYIHKELHCIV